MTKIKLVDGTIINASNVEVVNGTLKITTADFSVEELAELFGNFENTNYITLLTEGDKECGYKAGFTSFAGIVYDAEGNKTVELFQPRDVSEAKIASAAAVANMVNEKIALVETDLTDTKVALSDTEIRISNAESNVSMVNNKVESVETNLTDTEARTASIETDITDIQLALVELYESSAGGIE
jgi:chromosome segregation ATPase